MDTRAAVAFAAGKPLEVSDRKARRPQGRRGAGRDQGHWHLPHRRVHTLRRRPGRAVSGDPRPRGRRHRRRSRAGRHIGKEGRPCDPALHARVPAVPVVPVAQDQSLHRDPRDPGSGRDARRHVALLARGKKLHHYMGCSTFSNFTVLPEIAVAKIREDAPFDKVCYIGCGVTTGVGAVINTAKVEPGAKCVVFGLGGIGLNVIQGLRLAGADMIIGVDLNPEKKNWGERFGMTHFVNPTEVGKELVAAPRQHDQERRRPDRRRRLHLRLHRQCQPDAPRAGKLSSRLGRQRHHRRGRLRPGDRDAAVPARHRPGLEAALPSAAPEAAPTCPKSWTGTWRERSRSTR